MKSSKKILAIVLFAGMLVLIIVAVYMSDKNNKDVFIITDVSIIGKELLTKEDYLNTAGFTMNSPISQPIAEIRKAFMKHPYLASVEVELKGDNSLNVFLREKEFIASVTIGDLLFLLADQNELVQLDSNNKYLNFPLINESLQTMELCKENKLSAELKKAIKIIKAMKKIDINFYNKLSELNMRNGREPVMFLSDNASLFIIGKGNEAQKLLVIHNLLMNENFQHIVAKLDYVDVRYNNLIFFGHLEQKGIEL